MMQRLMLAISNRSPKARVLVDAAAKLARQLQADWFVVHVRQKPSLHYRMAATEHPVPEEDLAYAKKLGAGVIIEHGDVSKALVSFARKMSINYLITGRSFRPRLSFTWRLPLSESIQRELPETTVIIV
jgi:K+-sensing histidine kinase KdpD